MKDNPWYLENCSTYQTFATMYIDEIYQASDLFVERNRKWKSLIKDASVDTSQERRKSTKDKSEKINSRDW